MAEHGHPLAAGVGAEVLVQEAGRRRAVVVEEDQQAGVCRPGAGVARRRRAAVLAAHEAQAEAGLAGLAVPSRGAGGRRFDGGGDPLGLRRGGAVVADHHLYRLVRFLPEQRLQGAGEGLRAPVGGDDHGDPGAHRATAVSPAARAPARRAS